MKRLLALIFAAGVIFTFLTPMELGDAWWHLKTGQWIWQHGSIPDADPFSIAPPGRVFVLTSFWLFQLLMAGAYGVSGILGLIALKSLIFTAGVMFLNRILKDYGLGEARYIVLLPAIAVMTFYDEIRPQSISFMFFTAVLYLLERQRQAAGPLKWFKDPVFLLPLIMLIWSNMHAGFVSGLALIVFYSLAALPRHFIGRFMTHENGSMTPRLLTSSFLSLAAGALNPNGFKAVTLTFAMLLGSLRGSVAIHEHLPMAEFTSFTKESGLYGLTIALTSAGLLSFLLRLRKPDLFHLVLFSALGAASFVTFRAGMFMAPVAVIVIGKNLSLLRMPGEGRKKLNRLRAPALYLTGAALASAVLFFLLPRSILRLPAIDHRLIPVKAADFISAEKLPTNIFHPYEWGGYLIWRLNPKYRVFIDGRALGLMQEYSDVLYARPRWKDILQTRGVNTVIYWPLLPYKGSVPPVVFALLKDDGWSPVYWDLQAVAFVRTGLAKNPIGKTAVWELLASLISSNIIKSPSEPGNYIALGQVYIERGMNEQAKEALRQALALDPGNKEAGLWRKSIP